MKKNRGAAGCDGETIKQFDARRNQNLYKIWNRLSSGSYHPPPVLKQEIPKADGKVRILGIPTVTDRIAQGAVKIYLEEKLDRIFHEDSYGYRPGRSAHDALETTRKRCYRYDWVVEIDIQTFFDKVDHKLILKALEFHKVPKWVILYIKRWLEAPMADRNGNTEERREGTPQGGVISPLLANLFLHYGMDQWMQRNHSGIPFVRYADDGLLHCRTEQEADKIIKELAKRMKQIGLTLHPQKTAKVYVGRSKYIKAEKREFTFLGYDFKRRVLRRKDGMLFYRISPGASKTAMKRITKTIRGWKIHRSTNSTVEQLSQSWNCYLRGWINYYGKFWYRNFGYRLWSSVQSRLIRWAKARYKITQRKAEAKLERIRKGNPKLFAHWHMLQQQ